ncbi:MAG: MAPEG family protein, partial [Bosea sp. (in: a-proteobacteria)]
MLSSPLAAAGFYLALLLVMNVFLQARIIRQRRSKLIGVGHGNDRDLERAMRVHSNFAENAPLGAAALVLLALGGAAVWPVHLIGAMFLAGRVAHFIGFSQISGPSAGRVGGM